MQTVTIFYVKTIFRLTNISYHRHVSQPEGYLNTYWKKNILVYINYLK